MVVLVLAAMLRLTIATHYCGGEVAASKISVFGTLASCGMEVKDVKDNCEGTQLRSYCCDDVVTTYNIDNNYTPSTSFISELSSLSFQIFNIPADISSGFSFSFTNTFTSASPPGCLMSTAVDLSLICVFRI